MTGDSQYTQNTQINQVIGENEKCVFYFTEKAIQTFGQSNSLIFLKSSELVLVREIWGKDENKAINIHSSQSYGFLCLLGILVMMCFGSGDKIQLGHNRIASKFIYSNEADSQKQWKILGIYLHYPCMYVCMYVSIYLSIHPSITSIHSSINASIHWHNLYP